MKVTLDASVWLSANSPAERRYDECAELLTALVQRKTAIHQPALFVIEVCATIARRTGDRALALQAGRLALSMPHLEVHAMTHRAAANATDVAATCRLRGADAVYVATARDAGSTLITLDRELRERGTELARVLSPAEWKALSRSDPQA